MNDDQKKNYISSGPDIKKGKIFKTDINEDFELENAGVVNYAPKSKKKKKKKKKNRKTKMRDIPGYKEHMILEDNIREYEEKEYERLINDPSNNLKQGDFGDDDDEDGGEDFDDSSDEFSEDTIEIIQDQWAQQKKNYVKKKSKKKRKKGKKDIKHISAPVVKKGKRHNGPKPVDDVLIQK